MSDARPRLVEGVDYYYEGPYLVFTEKYLRDRGYCCENGCRHCPYGFRRGVRSDAPDAEREREEE
jgi:hypothetical protein